MAEPIRLTCQILALLLPVMFAGSAFAQPSGAANLSDSAKAMVEGLVKVPSAGFRQALEDLPADVAVHAIAEQINENGGFDILGSRVTAYEVLLFHHAAEYADGFEALVVGMDDRYAVKRAARALQSTPVERADRAGRILARKLNELISRNNQDIDTVRVVLHALSLLGPGARSATPSVKAVFEDKGNPYVTRLRAATALASVATPSAMVRATDQSDSLSVMIALSGLIQYPYQHLPFPEEPLDSMRLVADFIYSGYRSQISSVRDIALKYGPAYFGMWYKANPDEAAPYYDRLLSTIESLDTPDADAATRDQVQRSLKVLRDRREFRDSRRKK